jgi:Rieske 2Fe-2S family protein
MLQSWNSPRTRSGRRSYPTRANWKLVIENFIECYHCLPAHPEYSGVMKHVDAVGRDIPTAAAAWQDKVQAWFRTEANSESPVTSETLSTPRDASSVRIYREPIGGGRKTQSQDGEPVAPIMGEQRRFDGGYTGFSLRPFIAFVALNDHAVLFRFMPLAAENTEVELTWLVS